jgi:hypothetical protein
MNMTNSMASLTIVIKYTVVWNINAVLSL